MTPLGSTSRRMVAGGASLFIAAAFVRAALAMTGCLDITPFYVPPRETSSITEGRPCLGCLERATSKNGCGDTITRCAANTRCNQVYECMSVNACLDHPALGDKVNCILPCLTEAGIVSANNDPTVDLLIEVVQCGQTRCGVECNLDDSGGVDIDAL